jgi:hypothetical protein
MTTDYKCKMSNEQLTILPISHLPISPSLFYFIG